MPTGFRYRMEVRYVGDVVLVTGANKGLGKETAAQLARRGMTVLVGSRDAERGA